ncbi:MAG: tryptophan-rich sensory protein [Rivularia sp. (in: cyanobacteria)]
MKARWIIVIVSTAILVIGNLLSSLQNTWFQNLIRPDWLTFEFLIPFIWTFIWICTTISAIIVWEKAVKRDAKLFITLYTILAILTAAYSPVVVEFQSLIGGLIVGGLATLLVYILAIAVRKISPKASLLLVPYLLWGPVGTYLTWVLIDLNSVTAV